VPCSLDIDIIKLFLILSLLIILIFLLYEFFKINNEITAVNTSAIGNVHQNISVTFSDFVNKYATGNTKTTNLNKEIIRGLKAYLIDCKTP